MMWIYSCMVWVWLCGRVCVCVCAIDGLLEDLRDQNQSQPNIDSIQIDSDGLIDWHANDVSLKSYIFDPILSNGPNNKRRTNTNTRIESIGVWNTRK